MHKPSNCKAALSVLFVPCSNHATTSIKQARLNLNSGIHPPWIQVEPNTSISEAQVTFDAINTALKKSDEIRYTAKITLSKEIVEYRLLHK